MSKRTTENNKKQKKEVLNNTNFSYENQKDINNQQIDSVFVDNKIIDKKLVKSIEKKEKIQAKNAKKQEQKLKKERIKKRRQKIQELLKNRKLEEKKLRQEQEKTIREIEKRGKFASWFRLDNAASIYPSASDKDWNFVYRIYATMKNKVDPNLLQSAIDDILPRFPSFNVRLVHGFFWNYFERNFLRLKLQKEADFPCQPFNLNDNNSFLIRVLYSDHKIIFEAFHAISDGRGAMFFFNSLLARYIEKCGATIENYDGCSSYLDIPSEEEIEDSFLKYATKEKIKRDKEKPAHKIKGKIMPAGMVNSVEGEMSISKVKEVAKTYGVSVSVFLASVVGFCIYKRNENSKKPTRISVPIDLRSFFDSKTLRNFASYVNVEVKGKNLRFEDVVKIFKDKLDSVNKRYLQANINANVKLQRNIFIKIVPLFIKNIVMKICFKYLGENYQTLAFSNIGKVNVPKEFDDYVENYGVNLGRSLHNEKSIGIVSYKDKLNMCISSKLYETETERDVFKMLTKLSIPVKVYSNRRDLYGTK